MKSLRIGLMGLMGLMVAGCACNNASLRHYELVTTTDAKGNKSEHMALADSIAADLHGVTEVNAGRLSMKFSTDYFETTVPVYDAKGVYLSSVTERHLPGLYTSGVIKSQGVANRSFLDGMFSGITGTASSIGALFITGGAAKAILP